MKKFVINLLLLLMVSMGVFAQRITRQYNNVSFSAALKDLNAAQDKYAINFVYNELEDFKVTKSIRNQNVPDAIRQLIGFYPIKMTQMDNVLVVECIQKTPTKLIGRVIDTHHRPVDFANVALLNVQDSCFITGGVTNENGQFVIPCEARKAIVKVSCVGYNTYYNIYSTGKIGSITLKEATMNLQKVVVKATRPKTKLTHEGFQTQVQGTVLSDAGMATDLLKQVPRVRVDKDGNCSVFGKGTPEIYINGKKLTDKNELQTLSSKDVKNVTVITTPGAQYDATVNSVIRITTVKKQGYGWSGNFQSKYDFAMKNEWQEQAYLNYRVDGLDVFGGVMWNTDYLYDKIGLDEYIHGNQLIHQSGAGRMDARWNIWNGNFGVNYEIDKNNTIGLKYKLSSTTDANFTVTDKYSIYKDGVHQGDVDYLNDESASKETPIHEADFYYNGKVGKWGFDFNTTTLWRQGYKIQDATETSQELGDQEVGSNSHTNGRLLAGKLVVSYPIADKLNVNFGSEYTNSDSRTKNENKGGVAPSNDSKIKEQNLATFAEATWTWDNVCLKVGLRYEHVKSDYFEGGVRNSDMSRRYDNIFPNVSVSYDKGKWHTGLSFTSKTERPNYYRLSGYTRYTTRHTYESGNPNLLPTNIYDLEWNAQYSWLNISADYIYNKNVTLYSTKPFHGDADIALMYYENTSKIQNLQFLLEATPVIGPWHLDYTVGVFKQIFDVKQYGCDYNANRPMFWLDLENTLVLPHNWTALLEYFYRSRYYLEFGVNKAYSSLVISLVKSFFNKRLVVRFEANDLLLGMNKSWQYMGAYMHFTRTGINNTRSFGINVTYNFNATKSKYKGTGAGNAEKNRL